MILLQFGQHQPLNSQSETFTPVRAMTGMCRTLADCGWESLPPTIAPLVELIRRHVLARRPDPR